MIRQIQERLNRHQREQEGGAALIFAVLVLLVAMLVIVIISTSALTSATTSATLTSRDTYRDAANTGISNAILTANNSTTPNSLESYRGVDNAATGTLTSDSSNRGSEIKWRWYTQQVVLTGQRVGYYVYSTGYSSVTGVNSGVTLRAQLVPTSVKSGAYNKTLKTTTYVLSSDTPFQWGITGKGGGANANGSANGTDVGLSIEGSAKVYSADSYYGPTPNGTSTTGTLAATNTTMNLSATNSGLVQKSFATPNTTGSECTGPGCAQSSSTYRNFKIDTSSIDAKVTGQCAGKTLSIWRASEHGGVLDLNSGDCVSTLIFDVDTIVPSNWTSTTPLNIYNTGDTIVYKGVNVNKNNTPISLRIYAGGGGNLVVGSATNTYVNGNTYAGMYFASNSGTAKIYSNTTYFGAVSASIVNILDGSTFYLDLASMNLKGDATSHTIWTQTFIEEM